MAKESFVRGDDSRITHVRVTSNDGRNSELYRTSIWGRLELEEIAEHHEDGTTTAYKPSIWPGEKERK